MMEARQKVMEDLGAGGCYYLSLVRKAEEFLGNRRIDAVEKYLDLVRVGIMRLDGYLNDPAAVMQALYSGEWAWRKTDPEVLPGAGEFEVLRFERPTPGLIYSHFVLGDGRGGVAYDPLGKSRTVAEGQLVAKRMFKMIIGGAL